MTEPGTSRRLRKAVLVAVGILFGAAFLYLAFRDIDLRELLGGLAEMNPVYFFPAFILVILVQLLRAFRFGLILRPFCQLGLRDLWDVMNIWGALNVIVPARLAELSKPYLLKQVGAPFSSSLGAVMVERYFDLSALMAMLVLVLFTAPTGSGQSSSLSVFFSSVGLLLLLGLIFAYVLVLAVLVKRETTRKVISRITKILPQKAAEFVQGAADKLIDGLGIMANPGRALLILVSSLAVWMGFAAVTYLFLLSFSIEVPFNAAITIQVLLAFGIALPAAPGFIGTFHAVGRYALELYGVSALPAISFATVYHLFGVVVSIGMGVFSYFTGRFSFSRELIFGEPAETSTEVPASNRADASSNE